MSYAAAGGAGSADPEVAQLSPDDPEGREKALDQLHQGIDRATRLVDQLLTLSRLDSLAQLDDVQQVAIADLAAVGSDGDVSPGAAVRD